MRHVDLPAASIFGVDAATAVASAFNAGWLFARSARGGEAGRRTAAFTLALLNAGIAAQATFAQALFIAHRFGSSTEPFFAAPAWLASRAALFAGTLLLSLLILRAASR